jgi:hypothetical protein
VLGFPGPTPSTFLIFPIFFVESSLQALQPGAGASGIFHPVLRRVSSPLVALGVAACGPAFTTATGDGGPLASDGSLDVRAPGKDSGEDAASLHDATTEDASPRDGGAKEDGGQGDGSPPALDGAPPPIEASSCVRACPAGFDCLATKCQDRADAHFSATDNRPFNWSYGFAQSLGGPFQLYASTWSPGSSIDVWTNTTVHTFEPSVFHNSGLAATYDGMTIPLGALGLFPGPTGQASLVRWTAPAPGLYAIDLTFTGLSTPATRIDVGVFVNNITVMNGSGALNVYGGGNTFTLSAPAQMLSAGTFVDFYATNITLMDDPPGGTSLDARITAE